RNTVEICQFAMPLLAGIEMGDDGTFPDFTSCQRHGPKPIVLKGIYSQQVKFVTEYLQRKVNLSTESVAFLKPRGGNWFKTVKEALNAKKLKYVEITRMSEWPEGEENIALSTMYSAKGLEFDHVIIIGLSSEVTTHDPGPQDATLEKLRRLLAMAITR